MKTITTSPAHAHHPTLRHPPVGFHGGQVAFQREGGERVAYQAANLARFEALVDSVAGVMKARTESQEVRA